MEMGYLNDTLIDKPLRQLPTELNCLTVVRVKRKTDSDVNKDC